MTVSIDDELKRELSSVCKDMGTAPSTAFSVYAKAVVRERRIPFEVSADLSDVRSRRVYEAGVNEGLWQSYREFQAGDYSTREDYERARNRAEGTAWQGQITPRFTHGISRTIS